MRHCTVYSTQCEGQVMNSGSLKGKEKLVPYIQMLLIAISFTVILCVYSHISAVQTQTNSEENDNRLR